MLDMRKTVIPKSDQLNADDLIGRTMTIKVSGVKLCKEDDQPIAIHYEGDSGRPFKPCKSMRRVMIQTWGPDAAQYTGRMMTLYRDPSVKFGAADVGGIRISHMTDIAQPVVMALTATRATRKPFRVLPMPPNATPEGYQAVSFIETALAKMKAASTNAESWVAELVAALEVCPTATDLTALEQAEGVANARKKAPKEIHDRIEAAIKGAADRLANVAAPSIENDPALDQKEDDRWSDPDADAA